MNMMSSDAQPRAVPAAFVKWTEVQKVLEEANTGGIIASALMTHDGLLLSMCGGDASVEKVIGALVSSIWETYELEANAPYGAEQLQIVFLDCEVRLCV